MAGWGADDELVEGAWGAGDELVNTDPARRELPAGVKPSEAGAGRGMSPGLAYGQDPAARRDRRGGTRAEARPYVAPDEPPPAEPSLLERPYAKPLPDTRTPEEQADWQAAMVAEQTAPWKRQQRAREGAYVTGKGAGVLAKSGDPTLADFIERKTTPKPLDNTLGGALLSTAGDAAAILNDGRLSLTGGVFQLVQAGTNVMRLASGDSSEELQFLAGWADKAGDLARKARSSELKQQAAELSSIIADEQASPATVLGYLLMNPKLLTMQAVESAPSVLVAAGGGKLVGSLVERLSLRALGGAPASAAVAERIAELSAKGARAGAVGGEAALGAASVYDQVLQQGGSVAQASTAAGLAALGYAAIGRFTGGGAEGALAAGQRRGVGRAVLAETAQEGGQSLVESGAMAAGMGRELHIAQALNQAAAEAAVGGVVGGVTDAAMAARRPATPGQQFADAFEADTSERFFRNSDVDGFARAALTPGSVLTDPNAVRPEDTRAPVIRVEDMPTDLPDPAVVAQAAAQQQAQQAGQQAAEELQKAQQGDEVVSDGAAVAAAPAPAAATIGIAGVQQGSLASAADQQLRTNAQEAANAQAPTTQPAPTAVPARATGGARTAAKPADPAAAPAGSLAALRQQQIQTRSRLIEGNRATLEQLKRTGLTRKTSADVARLEDRIEQEQAYLDTWQNMQEAQDSPELQSFNRVASEVERIFGRKVVPYVDSRGDGAADGFAMDGQVYVNLASPERSVSFTIFHELQHVVRGEAKAGNRQSQLATQMLDQVWAMIPAEKKQSYAKNYLFRQQMDERRTGAMTVEQALADPLLKDEMLSDFMGQRADDQDFWRGLAKKEPKAFGAFVQRWIDTLAQIVAKLRGNRRAGNKDIDSSLAAAGRLERAKLVAERVLREWAASNPELAKQQGIKAPEQAPDQALSRRDFGEDDDKADLANELEAALRPEPRRRQSRRMTREMAPDPNDDYYEDQDGRGDMGAFNPFSDAVTQDDIDGITEELTGDLATEPPQPRAFDVPTDEVLSSVGVMAEAAYKPIEYTGQQGKQDAIIQFNAGGKVYSFQVKAREEGGFETELPGVGGVGQALSFRGVTEEFAKAANNRVAASVDLMRRGFDLFAAVPPSAAKRVLSTWQAIGKLPGAAEFKSPRFDASAPSVPKLQQILDSMFAGTKFTGTADQDETPGWYSVDMAADGQPMGIAQIQYIGGADRSIVLHTQNLGRGTSAGKAFYQAAFAFAHAIGVPVKADPQGLTGVNTYRRTEQMMSAAVRAGTAPDGIPGVGQRIYGWDKKAKTAADRGKNLVRLALAAARNAVELAPEARDLTYDLSTGAFDWRPKTKHSMGAEAYVSQALRGKDARVASMSRSTLARAAITFQAIDGAVKVDPDTPVKSPILYSTREEGAAPDVYAEAAMRQPFDYKAIAGRRVSYQVMVAETGSMATVDIDAAQAARDIDDRIESMLKLRECLGRGG